MSAIILDTETTGVDEKPDVIQLAWLPLISTWQPGQNLCLPGTGPTERGGVTMWKNRKPITLGAMAAHHIIEADLEGKPEWPGSWELPPATEYLIGHNIDFDWKAIGSPPVKKICTLALARKLWPEADSHSLTAMIYHLMDHAVARETVKGAHSAMVDAGFCHYLLVEILIKMPAITTWERVHAASEKARIPTHFTFGKYGPQPGQPGIAIAEVRRMDPSYIDWCINKCDQCQDEYWQRALRGQEHEPRHP